MFVLVEHYQETRQSKSAVSFIDFLVMHYVTDDGNMKDNERDSQLPFKSPDSNVTNGFSYCVPDRFNEFKLKPLAASGQQLHIAADNLPASAFLCFIWQPPKLA